MRLLLTSIALAGAFAFAGCGDDAAQRAPSQAQTTPSPITHQEFIVALDRLCKRGAEEGDRYEARAADVGNDRDALAALGDERVAARTRLTADLAKLQAPAEVAPMFTQYVRLTRRLDGLMPRFFDALRTNDDDEMMRIGNLIDTVQDERTTVAVDLGSAECG